MLSSNDPAIKVEAMSTSCSSGNFSIVESLVRQISLGSTGKDMGFVQAIESTFLGFIIDKS